MVLDPVQIRVLGSLIEKEIVTPEGYPLSLNALVNACNQRSSRDPVLQLDEDEVRQALHSLEDQNLVSTAHDSRVPKYEHRIRTVLNLRRDETAVLCLLMLRGPQTTGELRSRSERLYAFDDPASVQSTLDRLASRDTSLAASSPVLNATGPNPNSTGPLVTQLPRQPGSRESRYAHLLSGAPEPSSILPHPSSSNPELPSHAERLARLESEVALLTETLATLQTRLADLESGK